MASAPPKVLISYSHDTPQHAQHVLELASRLRADGIDCIIDQYVVSPAEGWPRWMDKQIRDSDFVVMVCTETYYQRVMGEEQPGKGLGVRWEGHLIYQAIYSAESMNTKFIPVLLESGNYKHIPAPVQSTTFYFAQTEDGYEDLYRRLTNQPRAIKPDLGKLRSLPAAERKSEGALGRLVSVPDLPPHFLPRLGDLQALKDAVLAGITKPVALTGTGKIGVQGMGGIGKTVLAAALTHDSEVRKAFPDGIFWLTVGQKPNLLVLQNQLLRQLMGSKETLISVQEAKDALREALEGKATLLVVDDAWTIDHVDAFSVTTPPARLLITTRNAEVLVGIGAEEHRVDVLSPSDALKMLAAWVGEQSPDSLPVEAAEVAKECGYLPLALAMIGAMIRLRPTAWKDALIRLQRADLGAIKKAFPGYPYPDLLRAIEVSIDGLESVDQERYLDLAVFPQDQPIPEAPLAILWKLDETDIRDCMTRFIVRSLATRLEGGAHEMLLLHDLQSDLIRKRREKNLPSLHLRLVEAWDALPHPPDTYAWRWVPYHLVRAGRKGDLRRVLLDFGYLQSKLAATDVNVLLADYNYFLADEELCLMQSAIRLSAHVLVHDSRRLAGQIIGRLFSNTAPAIQALLRQAAEKKTWPWLRPLQPNLTAAGGPLIRMLEGHGGPVRSVGITPEGRRAVSASDDGTLRLWDLESGQTIPFHGHARPVYFLAITRDGRRAVSASEDKTLRLWDLGTGESLRTLQGHTGPVRSVAITPDGCRAVSASDDGTLRLWDLESGQTIRPFHGHARPVVSVAITPDGHRAVSVSSGKPLLLWDLDSGLIIHPLYDRGGLVQAVAVTPDGCRAVSALGDGMLRIWNLESGQRLRTLQGHASCVHAVAITPDGRRAVSASEDKTLRLWDLGVGESLRTLQGHTGPVRSVAITRDGHRAVSASEDQTLRLWDLESGQSLLTLRRHAGFGVGVVAITPDGRRAVSAAGPTLQLWDLDSRQTNETLQGHTDEITAVAITADGRRVVSASADQTLWLWDLDSGQTLRMLHGHTGLVRAVAITPDGRHVVSGSYDKTLRLWDLESGQTIHTLQGHFSVVEAVAVTPDGCRAISASNDLALRLWDLESGQMIRLLRGHSDMVLAVAVTPDGRWAVSASVDQTLRLWDLESGETLRTLQGHTGPVFSVVITPDGRCAVTASSDRTLRLWDLENGQTLRTLHGDTGYLGRIVITPDGRRFVSGSRDLALRLRDLESGQTLCTLQGHTGPVWDVAITPDGRRAVSASWDQTLRLWDLDNGKEIATFVGEYCVRHCAVTPDGRTIIAGDDSGRVHFLQIVEGDPTKSSIGETKIQLLQRNEP